MGLLFLEVERQPTSNLYTAHKPIPLKITLAIRALSHYDPAMRLSHFILVSLSFAVSLLAPAAAQDISPALPVPPLPPANTDRLPGVALAEGITQITGVAISPMLGVCGVGTWRYFTSTPEERLSLPWFCHPLAWGIGLGLLSLCLIKDLVGTAMPAMLKKPLDVIELFEGKLSAIIASAAFIPFITSEITKHFAAKGSPVSAGISSALSSEGLAMASPILANAPLLMLSLLLPISLIAFFAVWLTSHSLNVLLLLSPFSILDLLLKAARVFLLGCMGLLYFIQPVIAAILCGILIAMALYLAPRTFRVCVFGTVMSVDFIRSLIWKGAGSGKTRAFLARQGSPTLAERSFGTLTQNEEGRIHFSSRILLIGPRRNLILPEAGQLSMQKGFIFPSVRVRLAGSEKTDTLLHLLPRHRHDLEAVAATLGIAAIHDHFVGRGVKAASRWMSESFRGNRELIETRDPAGR